MPHDASGFQLRQPAWFVAAPADWDQRHLQRLTYDDQMEEVFSQTLASGLVVSALRGGIAKFDFSATSLGTVDLNVSDDFDELVSAAALRIRVMNAWSLCFHLANNSPSGGYTGGVTQVRQVDVLHFRSEGGMGGPGLRGVLRGESPVGWVYPATVLAAACDALDDLETNHPELIDIVVLLNEAVAAYTEHNFTTSVMAAWTVCEVLVDQLWTGYYTGTGKTLSAPRKDFLSGRDFTASVVHEVLNHAGVLSDELHETLNAVRKARNKWVHSMKQPEEKTAREAQLAAATLLASAWGREVTIPMARGITW